MKIKLFMAGVMPLAILTGCNANIDEPTPVTESEPKETSVGSDIATADEASTVADKFMGRLSPGRSRAAYSDATTMQISDSCGNPLMYVINYGNNNGFVIVSASKDYEPVLAYSDKGHFDIDIARKTGASIWLNAAETTIASVDTISPDMKMFARIEWEKYLPQTKPATVASQSSRANYNGYDIDAIKQAAFDEWYHNGWYVYTDTWIPGVPTHSPTAYPSEINWQLDEIRSDNSSFFMTGRPLIEDTYVVGWDETESKRVDPLMKTQWGQQAPFNYYLQSIYPNSTYLGCTTVAVGQILRFREDLPGYDYYIMPDTRTSFGDMNYAGKFLYDIGRALKIDYSNAKSGASLKTVKNALKKWGYSFEEKEFYQETLAMAVIYSKSPVYIRASGRNDKTGEKNIGHAWVCDGATYNRTTYYFYVMVPNPTPEDAGTGPYKPWSWPAARKEHSYYSYHFNWGYYGEGDGFYSGSVFNIKDCIYYKDITILSNIKKN